MADPLILQLTDAGAAAVQGVSGSDQVVVSGLGLTATPFDAAPTITALPGEFKRLPVTSGTAAAVNIAHLTVYDTSADTWSATGFGLFLADGTLFATYSQSTAVLDKASLAFALLAFDIRFAGDFAASIDFGVAIFTWPPATTTTRGIARLATRERVNADADDGDDDQTIVTPSALRGRFAARTISGGGLVSGGGNLSADRTLTVAPASAAELQAASATDKAVSPAAFGGLPRLRGTSGYEVFPGGTLVQRGLVRGTYSGQQTLAITFPIAFADTNYDLQLTDVIPVAGNYDNYFQEIAGTRATTGVSIFLQDPSSGASGTLSGLNWRAEGVA